MLGGWFTRQGGFELYTGYLLQELYKGTQYCG